MSKVILKNAARYMSPDRKIFVKGVTYDDKELAKVPKEDKGLFAPAPSAVEKPDEVKDEKHDEVKDEKK